MPSVIVKTNDEIEIATIKYILIQNMDMYKPIRYSKDKLVWLELNPKETLKIQAPIFLSNLNSSNIQVVYTPTRR